jgi:tetratricopeptide (TPR) repeat protein
MSALSPSKLASTMKCVVPMICLALATLVQAQISKPDEEMRAGNALEAILKDFESERYDEALGKLDLIDSQRPNDPVVLNLIGSIYIKKNDFVTARSVFEKSLEVAPGFFPSEYNLGELLFLKKEYSAARDHFQAMRSDDSRHELLQFKVVLCDILLGEFDRAGKVMKTIKYPGDSPAWYYAHAAWANQRRDTKKAREYIRGAKYIFGSKCALFDETFQTLGLNLN